MDLTIFIKGVIDMKFVMKVFGTMCFMIVTDSFPAERNKTVHTISRSDVHKNFETYLDLLNILVKLELLQDNTKSGCVRLDDVTKQIYAIDSYNNYIEIKLGFIEQSNIKNMHNVDNKGTGFKQDIAVQTGHCVVLGSGEDLELLSMKRMEDNITLNDKDEQTNKSLAAILLKNGERDTQSDTQSGTVLTVPQF